MGAACLSTKGKEGQAQKKQQEREAQQTVTTEVNLIRGAGYQCAEK